MESTVVKYQRTADKNEALNLLLAETTRCVFISASLKLIRTMTFAEPLIPSLLRGSVCLFLFNDIDIVVSVALPVRMISITITWKLYFNSLYPSMAISCPKRASTAWSHKVQQVSVGSVSSLLLWLKPHFFFFSLSSIMSTEVQSVVSSSWAYISY